MPRLEPARKDGWTVVSNKALTAISWIAPDGTTLRSYSSAVAYGININKPVLGMDGISQGIGAFFGSSKPKSPSAKSPSAKSPSANSPSAKSSSTPSPVEQQPSPVEQQQSTPQTPSPKNKSFAVPNQTESGEEFQALCRVLGGKLSDNKRTDLDRVFAQYLRPNKLKNDFANKVIFDRIAT